MTNYKQHDYTSDIIILNPKKPKNYHNHNPYG